MPVVELMLLGSSASQVHIAVFSLVAVCGTRAFHNRQTAPFYAHSQLRSTTLEKHAEQRKWQHLQNFVHKEPWGPVTEIYSDTPVLKQEEKYITLTSASMTPMFASNQSISCDRMRGIALLQYRISFFNVSAPKSTMCLQSINRAAALVLLCSSAISRRR